MRRTVQAACIAAVALGAALAMYSCGSSNAATASAGKQLIILGIDGMDPNFLGRHWDALPNLDRLRHDGDFKLLQTVMPAQSPVAWSTFITGADPGTTGIYDFIHRRPETLELFSSMAESGEGGYTIPLGPYRLPLSKGKVRSLRHGTPFWRILSDHGVPCVILRMPTNFPPVDSGTAIAGLGTPDLRGTFGTFTFYTDDPDAKTHSVSGGEIVRVNLDGQSSVELKIAGPANTLRADRAPTSVAMRINVDPTTAIARFEVDGKRFILRQGEWSGWIRVHFPLMPALSSAAGMFRIYAKQLHPRLRIYVSPINIDPSEPALPIAAPDSYSRKVADAIGPFYTQGSAQDTSAWRQHVLTREEYLEQSRGVSEQMLAMLRHGIEEFHEGVLFFHFYGSDQNSHMLWGDYEDDLLATYRMMDDTLGWVRRKRPEATLIVMSDHGFTRFDRAVHVNAWLRAQGYLSLRKGATTGGENFADINWSRTRAYAAGLNSIYINQEGRELYGIVSPGPPSDELIDEIRGRLLEFRDPDHGAPVVHSVAVPARDFHGDELDLAPDLIVGYYPGYRGSWQTALGATPAALIDDNNDPWRGDHCIDPAFVPGVLITDRKVRLENPHLYDLPVTALSEFGIEAPGQMTGASVF